MTQQYGTVKVDVITYTSGTGGSETDQSITVSSLATISRTGIIVTGDIEANNITANSGLNVGGLADVSGLVVGHDATITGNLIVGSGIQASSLVVQNDATVSGALNVSGLATVSGLTVTGDTSLNTLTVTGTINASGVNISGFTGLFASGTAAAPSISFEDDTDTGFYLSNTNELSAAINGQQRLIVSRSGTVNVNGSLTAGRNFQQYIELIGNSGGNFIQGVSASGNSKPTVLQTDAFSTSINIRTNSANPIIFSPGGVEKFRMTELGRLGVGASNPTQKIVVAGSDIDSGNVSDERRGTIHLLNIAGTPAQNTIGNALSFSRLGSGRRKAMIASVQTGTNENQTGLTFYTYNGTTTSIDSVSERVRLDSTGRVFINQTESIAGDSGDALIQAEALVVFSGKYSGNNINPAIITLFKDRNSAIVKDNDGVGRLQFEGFDGTAYKRAAAIDAFVDGTPGSGDMPGRLVFSTTPDGSSTPEGRMYITSSGDVGIGTTNPQVSLDVWNGSQAFRRNGTQYILFTEDGTGNTISSYSSSNNAKDLVISNTTDSKGIVFRINNASGVTQNPMNMLGTGGVQFPWTPTNQTTANAANVFMASNGSIYLSTSSSKYKTDITPIDSAASHALLDIQPVSYRSLGVDDNPDWTWYGFIAEDVEKIDPRLVTYKTCEYTTDEEGTQTLQAVTPEPNGVAYERFIPHLLLLIKEQKETIASLEARVAALEE